MGRAGLVASILTLSLALGLSGCQFSRSTPETTSPEAGPRPEALAPDLFQLVQGTDAEAFQSALAAAEEKQINSPNEAGELLLELAVRKEKLLYVEWLLEKGALPLLKSPKSKMSSYHLAEKLNPGLRQLLEKKIEEQQNEVRKTLSEQGAAVAWEMLLQKHLRELGPAFENEILRLQLAKLNLSQGEARALALQELDFLLGKSSFPGVLPLELLKVIQEQGDLALLPVILSHQSPRASQLAQSDLQSWLLSRRGAELQREILSLSRHELKWSSDFVIETLSRGLEGLMAQDRLGRREGLLRTLQVAAEFQLRLRPSKGAALELLLSEMWALTPDDQKWDLQQLKQDLALVKKTLSDPATCLACYQRILSSPVKRAQRMELLAVLIEASPNLDPGFLVALAPQATWAELEKILDLLPPSEKSRQQGFLQALYRKAQTRQEMKLVAEMLSRHGFRLQATDLEVVTADLLERRWKGEGDVHRATQELLIEARHRQYRVPVETVRSWLDREFEFGVLKKRPDPLLLRELQDIASAPVEFFWRQIPCRIQTQAQAQDCSIKVNPRYLVYLLTLQDEVGANNLIENMAGVAASSIFRHLDFAVDFNNSRLSFSEMVLFSLFSAGQDINGHDLTSLVAKKDWTAIASYSELEKHINSSEFYLLLSKYSKIILASEYTQYRLKFTQLAIQQLPLNLEGRQGAAVEAFVQGLKRHVNLPATIQQQYVDLLKLYLEKQNPRLAFVISQMNTTNSSKWLQAYQQHLAHPWKDLLCHQGRPQLEDLKASLKDKDPRWTWTNNDQKYFRTLCRVAQFRLQLEEKPPQLDTQALRDRYRQQIGEGLIPSDPNSNSAAGLQGLTDEEAVLALRLPFNQIYDDQVAWIRALQQLQPLGPKIQGLAEFLTSIPSPLLNSRPQDRARNYNQDPEPQQLVFPVGRQ